MQIGGNYNSYSDANYNYATHTHHFTECLHEEQVPKKQEGGAAASSGVTVEIRSEYGAEKLNDVLQGVQVSAENSFWKKGIGFFQGIWNAMGQEGQIQQNAEADYSHEDTVRGKGLLRGVNTVISAIRQGFNVQIAERLETVREKLKVGIHTALKRFGKDSQAFGALTDPGTGSLLGGRTGSGASGRRDKSGTRQDENEMIKTAAMSEEHLMDSYSKNGTYCKINENLTYQQGRAPYKVSDKADIPKEEVPF
ncbi:MAG: hypothetical protein IJ409_11385 [Lachnospiraceae bacterium]|nr:hypothetical protein [Lachnospiraceae bacterium]